jgi:hypothetical protein
MNELVEKLAKQATSGDGWIFDKDKFAELIVRECMDIAVDVDRTLEKHGYLMAESDAAKLAGWRIAKHFGVEE